MESEAGFFSWLTWNDPEILKKLLFAGRKLPFPRASCEPGEPLNHAKLQGCNPMQSYERYYDFVCVHACDSCLDLC